MRALLNLLLGSAHAIMHMLTRLGERRFPLRVPLLQPFISHLKYLGLGGTQLFFVSRGLSLSRCNRAPRLFDRT